MKYENNLIHISLTDKAYWDRIAIKSKLPSRVDLKSYHGRRFNELFQRIFGRKKLPTMRFIEIGCAPGRWMAYFNKVFGFDVTGIDFSDVGCRLTELNLKYLGVKGCIVKNDFLCHDFKIKFDVVFSYGFIEHFRDTSSVLEKHVKILNEGGYLVIIIPNFESRFYRFLQKLASKEVMSKHKVVTLNELVGYLKKLNVRILYASYFGTFNLGVINFRNSWVGRFSTLIYCINTFIIHLLLKLGIKIESRTLSPYIVVIGLKEW